MTFKADANQLRVQLHISMYFHSIKILRSNISIGNTLLADYE